MAGSQKGCDDTFVNDYVVPRLPNCFMANTLTIGMIKLYVINPVLCDVLLTRPYKRADTLLRMIVLRAVMQYYYYVGHMAVAFACARNTSGCLFVEVQ